MILISVIDHYLRLKAKLDWKTNPKKLGRVHLGYVENKGTFHGLLKESPKTAVKLHALFVACAIFFVFYSVLTRKKTLTQIGWVLAAIGGMSNLWDRAMNGYVTDYFSFDGKLYFNLADFFVFLGVTMIFLSDIFSMTADKIRQSKAATNEG